MTGASRRGECYSNYPELFRTRDDGFPEVIVERPEGDQAEDALDAVRGCPGNAIKLEEA